jgi:hypothetical protein
MVNELETWLRGGGHRRAVARSCGKAPCAAREKSFDDAILERMERHDDQAATGRQHGLCCGQTAR